MDKWSQLSMSDRAKLIKLFVKNGITSLDDIRSQFNSFQDGGPRKTFDQWKQEMGKKYPWLELDSKVAGYDYERYFNENYDDAVSRLTDSQPRHFTDKYKLPNHPTFSNESIYSEGPSYGGTWDQNDKFTPSIINMQQHPNIYKEYRPYSEEEIYSKKYASGGLLDGPDDPPDIVKLIKKDVENVKNNPNIAVDSLKPTYDPRKPVSVTNYPASGALAKDKITLAAETLPTTVASGIPKLAAKAVLKGMEYLANPVSNTLKAVGINSEGALTSAAALDRAYNVYQTGIALGSTPDIYTDVRDRKYDELPADIFDVVSGIAGYKGLKNNPTKLYSQRLERDLDALYHRYGRDGLGVRIPESKDFSVLSEEEYNNLRAFERDLKKSNVTLDQFVDYGLQRARGLNEIPSVENPIPNRIVHSVSEPVDLDDVESLLQEPPEVFLDLVSNPTGWVPTSTDPVTGKIIHHLDQDAVKASNVWKDLFTETQGQKLTLNDGTEIKLYSTNEPFIRQNPGDKNHAYYAIDSKYKGYTTLPDSPDAVRAQLQHDFDLIPHGGQAYLGNHYDLSTDSYRLFLGDAWKRQSQGLGYIDAPTDFEGNHLFQKLNSMGSTVDKKGNHLSMDKLMQNINDYIDRTNKVADMDLPHAVSDGFNIYVPSVRFNKYKKGGFLKK